MANPIVYFFVHRCAHVTPPDGRLFHFVNPATHESLVHATSWPVEVAELEKSSTLDRPIDLLIVEDELGAVKDILAKAVECAKINVIGVCATASCFRRALEVLAPPRVIALDFLLPPDEEKRANLTSVGQLYLDARNTWKDSVILGLTGYATGKRESPEAHGVRELLNRNGDVVFTKNAHLYAILPDILLDALNRWSLRCRLNAWTEGTARERGADDATIAPEYREFFAPAKSKVFLDAIRQANKLAGGQFPILLLGESGTGKEQFARFIRRRSGRSGAFVAINCATIPGELAESQLFGHVMGAFSGATRDHTGVIEQANNGTLFLDEVGDLALSNQVKLLRVLQNGEFQRVGSARVRRSSFHLVCATNQDLEQMVREGRFREDLYYRLNVGIVRLPSLCERREDIPDLVDYLLTKHKSAVRFAEEALTRLDKHSWPGNVRELENLILQVVTMHEGAGDIGADELQLGERAQTRWPSQAMLRFKASLALISASKVSEIAALLTDIENGLQLIDEREREQATLSAVRQVLYGSASNSLHNKLNTNKECAALLLATREGDWPLTCQNVSVRKVVDTALVRVLRGDSA